VNLVRQLELAKTMQEETEDTPPKTARMDLVRDVLVLQLKLIVDGLRDLVLLPASLIAGIISLIKHEDGRPGPEFYQLLRFGKLTERRINLFGVYSNRSSRAGNMNVDDLVSRVESYVVDEYRRGELSAQAKAKIDQALDAIQGLGKKPE
jgi:hypothetical protein